MLWSGGRHIVATLSSVVSRRTVNACIPHVELLATVKVLGLAKVMVQCSRGRVGLIEMSKALSSTWLALLSLPRLAPVSYTHLTLPTKRIV